MWCKAFQETQSCIWGFRLSSFFCRLSIAFEEWRSNDFLCLFLFSAQDWQYCRVFLCSSFIWSSCNGSRVFEAQKNSLMSLTWRQRVQNLKLSVIIMKCEWGRGRDCFVYVSLMCELWHLWGHHYIMNSYIGAVKTISARTIIGGN